MVRKPLASLLILSALLCLPVYGAQQIRPKAGIGLLIIRPFSPDRASEISRLTLYNYPGVQRILEVGNDAGAELHPVLAPPSGVYAVGVTGKKGNWLKIAYDDAGREGWVKMERYWVYTPWESFLKGRSTTLLPKLRKSSYQLRKDHSESSEPLITLSSLQKLQVVAIEGDWARVMVEGINSGWLRWRDAEGRLMISLSETVME
jgi:hypothetical protein